MATEQAQYPFAETEMWKTSEYHGILFGGGLALHLQIAHPLIAQALHDSKFLEKDPYHRLEATANAGVNMIFGTQQESQSVADVINMIHRGVTGKLEDATGIYPARTPYDARDPKLVAWVAAALMRGSMVGHELTIGKLSEKQKTQYIEDSKGLFSMIEGFNPADFPSTNQELEAYIRGMISSRQVEVSPLARKMAPNTLLDNESVWRQLNWKGMGLPEAVGRKAGRELVNGLMTPFKIATIYALPDELREQFGYKEQAPWQKKLIQQTSTGIQRAVPYMPPVVRYFGQFRNAQSHLREQRRKG